MILKDQNQISPIGQTVGAFNSGISSMEPKGGISLTDSWVSTMRNSNQSDSDLGYMAPTNALSPDDDELATSSDDTQQQDDDLEQSIGLEEEDNEPIYQGTRSI